MGNGQTAQGIFVNYLLKNSKNMDFCRFCLEKVRFLWYFVQ